MTTKYTSYCVCGEQATDKHLETHLASYSWNLVELHRRSQDYNKQESPWDRAAQDWGEK